MDEVKDLFVDWLDFVYGSEVIDNFIFFKLFKFWEEEFYKDMEVLNVSVVDFFVFVFGSRFLFI